MKDKSERHKGLFQTSVAGYIFTLFSLYLLFFTNGYLNIQETRARFFTFSTIVLSGLCLLSFLLTVLILKFDRGYVFEAPLGATLRGIAQGLSVTDYAMLAFVFCCAIGTLFSGYPAQSFSGGYGRFMGLQMYLLIALMYFLVSRGYHFQNVSLSFLLATTGFMTVVAVLQYLKFDPFGLYQGIEQSQKGIFISTIGNINFFSGYIALVLPISACSFCFCEKQSSKIVYAASTLLCFLSLLVSRTASGLVAAVVLFFFLGLYAFKNMQILKRYLFVILLFFLATKLLRLLIALRQGQTYPTDAVFHELIDSNIMYVPLILSLGLFLFLHYWQFSGHSGCLLLKKLRFWFALYAIGALALVSFCVVWFSFVNKQQDIGVFGEYFRLNKQWGTGRGEIFASAIAAFAKFNPFQKLFGFGMDMFKIITRDFMIVTVDTQNRYVVYDQTHNELLGYLLSAGALGVTSYVVFVVSQIVKSVQKCQQEPLLLAFAIGMTCYFIQSMSNIAEPMVAPLFFLVIAITESVHREMKASKSHP